MAPPPDGIHPPPDETKILCTGQIGYEKLDTDGGISAHEPISDLRSSEERVGRVDTPETPVSRFIITGSCSRLIENIQASNTNVNGSFISGLRSLLPPRQNSVAGMPKCRVECAV